MRRGRWWKWSRGVMIETPIMIRHQVGAEGAVVAGYVALPNALLTLTPTLLALHCSRPCDLPNELD